MGVLETRISTFKNTRSIEVQKGTIDTVGLYLERIKNGTYKKTIEKVRAGNEEAKLDLPTIAFHGIFKNLRKKEDFIESSGLIILDIDDIDEGEDFEEIKKDIMDSDDSVLAVMISPSGNGLKILYYVLPDLVNADSYRQIGKKIVADFSIYGTVDYLSITDCLIMTYDPNILINEKATPAFIFVQEAVARKSDLEPVDESRILWEDAEDFFETVLSNDIAAKTSNNFHYIQVAILDLAKFGFKHPKHDLSFVVDYAEENFKYSSDNKKRFLEVVEVAKAYPQIRWAYKMINSDDEDDEYIDYTNLKDSNSAEDNQDKVDVVKGDGMIDYSTFLERVIAVMLEGDRVGFETSHKDFSNIFRFKGTGILTITGIPGHGKTEFVDSCIVDLARLYGHLTFVAGFEQTPEEHVIKLVRKIVGVNVTCPSWFNAQNRPEFDAAYNFITNHIRHVDTTTVGGNINKILEILAIKIKEARDNGQDPKYVVIDPFNMLSIKGRFSGHEKIEEILRRLTHFSHQMDVLVILVAHPFKMRKDEKTGDYLIPDFYSVKGSSAFFEMSYHGLVVYRNGYLSTDTVLVKVLKVKQNNLGITGESVNFLFEKGGGRYIPVDAEGNEQQGDHSKRDWLEKALKIQNNK